MTASAARALFTAFAKRQPVLLLHGEDAVLGNGPVSDIDCAVASDAFETAVSASMAAARELGFRLVVVWPYDTRGLGLFFATADMREVVHLDLLADDEGLGKYGVITDALLTRARTTDHGWLGIDPIDGLLYLLSKRTLKKQDARVAALRAAGSHFSRDELNARAEAMLSPVARARVLTALGIGPRPRRGAVAAWALRRVVGEAGRRLRRMRHPVGIWIHVVDPDAPTSGFLSGSGLASAPPPVQFLGTPGPAEIGRAFLSRWRHAVTITTGPRRLPGASMNLQQASGERGIVAALQAHALESLAVHGQLVVPRQPFG